MTPNVYIISHKGLLSPAVYLDPEQWRDGSAMKRLGSHEGRGFIGYSRVLDVNRNEERSVRNDCIAVIPATA